MSADELTPTVARLRGIAATRRGGKDVEAESDYREHLAAKHLGEGNEIRVMYERSGLSYDEFAGLAGATRDALRPWFRGSISPATRDILRARLALLAGDEAQALAVLRETLPKQP